MSKIKPATTSSLVLANSSLTLTLKWSQVEPVKTKIERRLAKKVKQDGFRQGKVPFTVAKTYLNPQAVIESTLEQLLPDAFIEQVKKMAQPPIVPPEYVVKKAEIGQDWQIEAIYAVRPEVKLGNYQPVVKSALKEAETRYQKELKAQDKVSQQDKKSPAKKVTPPGSPTEDYLLSAVYKQLVATIRPAVQELLIQRETQSELENLASKLESVHISFADYLKKSQLTFEQLRTELAAQSLGRLQLIFILQAIAEQAKLSVSDSQLDQELKDQKANPQLRSMAREHLLHQKIASHLLALNK